MLYSWKLFVYREGDKMTFSIENMPQNKIAYIRRIGPYGIDNKETMEKLKSWARNNNLLNGDSIILGIAWDNPEIMAPENCRYDTCLIISKNCESNDYINYGNIVGGKYAVFKIEHTAEAVKEAWMNIFSELSRQNHFFDETRPIIERYTIKMVNDHFCEICVPVK